MKRNAFIGLLISIMLLMWVGCDTGSASSADSNTNNTGITNGNGNDGNDNNGENNNNNDDENGDNNGNDNEENNGDNGNGNSSSELFPAPTNFRVVSTTSSSVSLTWDEVSGAYHYIIGYGDYSNSEDLQVEYSDTNNATIYELKSNTKYYFIIAALDKLYDNMGTISSHIYETTALAELLPAPTNLYKFASSTDSISVAWDAVKDAYAYGVTCREVDNNYDLVGTPQTDVVYSGHQYTFTDLKSDTWYCIGVTTYNNDGKPNREPTITYAFTKAIYVQPDYLMAPDMYTISFTTNEQGLRITWEDSAKSGQYYNLYRANSKNSSYSIIEEGLTDAAYDDLNVNLDTVGNSYFYKVKLVSSSTESDFSSAIGVTMQYPIVNKIYLPAKKVNRTSGTKKFYRYYKSGQAKIDGVSVSSGKTINNTGMLSIQTRYTYSDHSDFSSSTTTNWNTWSKEWEFKPSRKYTINILDKTVNYEYNLELE